MEEYVSHLMGFIDCFLQSFSTNLITFLTSLIVFYAFYSHWKNRDLPPGPLGFPVVGYLPFLSDKPHLKLEKLAEKYGPVLSFKIPGYLLVCLGNYDAIKEAFVRQANVFSGKPQEFYIFRWLMESSGLTTAEGEMFTEQRRFLLHTLRDFGFGRLSLEGRVHEVVERMLEVLERTRGEPYDVQPLIYNGTANVIASILFDKLYELDDSDFVQQRKDVNVILRYMPGIEGFRPQPFLRCLPWQWLPQYKDLVEAKERLYQHIDEIIHEHQRTFDPSNLRDYVDVHLDKLQKAERGSKDEKYFKLSDLRTIALNMFLGGTDTSANSIHWGLKFLALHPQVQRKIQQELDQVVGQTRLPSMTDSHHLPYTEATLMEINRLASVVCLTPLHSTTEETTLCGYRIPKRSLVVANLHAAHQDPKYWPQPEKFRPENFLGPDGKVAKKDSYVPFSLGKRYCPGDSLAKMDIFHFITAILQKFNFELAEGDDGNMDAFVGITGLLQPYKLKFIPRSGLNSKH